MTLKANTFDSGTQGTAVTNANSASSGDGFGGVTSGVAYDATHVMHGGMAAKITAGANYVRYGYGSFQKFAARGYFYMGADGSTNEIRPLTFLGANTTNVASVVFRQDGWVLVKDSTGANVYANNAAWQPNTWYRIEMFVDVAAGSVQYAAYLGDSMTVFDSYSGTGMNYGTGNAVTAATFGNRASVDATVWFDTVAQDDAATGLIGPYTMPTSPTVYLTQITDNTGGWTPSAGTIVDALSDGSDSTYIDGTGDITGNLGNLGSGPVTITVRADNTGGGTSLTGTLFQGTTQIATHTWALTSTKQDLAYTLTSTEQSAITDRASLKLKLSAS